MRRGGGSGSPEPPRTVLVAGLSTRALAESAVRAGWRVASVDAFGDLDHPARPAISLARDVGVPYSPRAIVDAARALDAGAVAYVASFENHPRAVEALARGRALLGNSPRVLERVRDPLRLARTLRAHGHPAPATRASPPPLPPAAPAAARGTRWLSKPRASGGGGGIAPWRPGDPLPRSRILQERIDGVPGSLVFAADGHRALPFALSRQLVGERALGASGYRYCGSILSAWPGVLEAAAEMAHRLVEAFALVGVNGLDFVARDGVPVPVEVNPRPSASMELAERAFGFSVFAAHAAGCGGEGLPAFDLAAALRERGAVGKAVLYAREAVTVGDTRAWLEDDDVRDVPHPGEHIAAGHPICTVFARAASVARCRAALVRRARALYEELGNRRRRLA